MTLVDEPMVEGRTPGTPTDPPAPSIGTPPKAKHRPTRLWFRGAVAGLASGALGLAIGEVVAGVDHELLSPVIGVGNKAIDLVPVPVKTFAISTFGRNDKKALVIGMLVAIAVFAMVVGAGAIRRRWVGFVGLTLFGALGVAAAVEGRTGTAADAIPSLIATVVAMVALDLLTRVARGRQGAPSDNVETASPSDRSGAPQPDRRRFLSLTVATGAAAAGAAVLGRKLQSSTTAVADRARRVLPRPAKALAAAPAGVQAEGLGAITPFFTPNKGFYRIDTALVVPRIDASSWSLAVKGMVDKPLTFSYDELLKRTLVERDITLTCVSNEVGGQLMGNARWVGVPLRELLEEAGVKNGASQVVGRSTDGWTSGFPTAAVLDGRDALVALAMNGEPLPFAHGYPARLIVPGLYGYVSATKWLSSIELTTLADFDAYWVPRGYAKQAPIKMASRIDVPRGLATVAPGKTAVAGIAWAQRTGIAKVELQFDGGQWVEADLADEQSIDTWRQWHYAWDATPGRHEIAVRSTDKKGRLQIEERTAPLPSGATGWHSIIVLVSGS